MRFLPLSNEEMAAARKVDTVQLLVPVNPQPPGSAGKIFAITMGNPMENDYKLLAVGTDWGTYAPYLPKQCFYAMYAPFEYTEYTGGAPNPALGMVFEATKVRLQRLQEVEKGKLCIERSCNLVCGYGENSWVWNYELKRCK